jgi:hypothetical protein
MFLHVDNPDGTQLVHIDVVNPDDDPYQDPFIAFEQAYKTWRSNAISCKKAKTTKAPAKKAKSTKAPAKAKTTKAPAKAGKLAVFNL